MNNQSLRFKASIDLIRFFSDGTQNPLYRSIVLEDTTDYDGLGIPLSELTGAFTIQDPVGAIIHLGDLDFPDIEHSVSKVFDNAKVSLDAFGQPLYGTYVFQMRIRRTLPNQTVQEYQTAEIGFDLCLDEKQGGVKPSIELLFDCNTAQATGHDRTKYKSGSEITRQITLVPPVGAKFIDGTDAMPIISPSNIAISSALWTGKWQMLLRSTVSETIHLGALEVDLEYSLEASTNASAACNINVCGLYACIDKYYREMELAASRKGGVANNIVLADGFIQITSLLDKFQIARECGKVSEAAKYYEQIKDLIHCDCSCGNMGVPEFVYPLVSPPGNNVIVEGSQYVTVQSTTIGNTTTYAVALSTQLKNLISLIKQYAFTSPNNSINISNTSSGVSELFTLTVNTSVIDELLGAEVNATCLSLNGEKLSVIVQELIDRACQPGLPPVAEPDLLVCAFETANSILVTANDFFTSNVVVTITTAPINGSAVVESDGKTITYTPDGGFSGQDVLTYTITDVNGQTSSATLTITVNDVAGESCVAISAGFVAGLSVQAGALQIVLTNITNYLTNIPVDNDYTIEVRDSDNNVLETYMVSGRDDSIAQVYVVPDAPLSSWNNIRIVQTVVSEDITGASCGSVQSTNTYTMPQITSSIFAGVDVACLGVTNADPDSEIMQELIDKACASLVEVETENGISGDGTTASPVKLGGDMTEDATIAGNFAWLLTLNRLILQGASNTYRQQENFGARKLTIIDNSSAISTETGTRQALIRHEIFVDDITVNLVTAGTGASGVNFLNQEVNLRVGGNDGRIESGIQSGERIRKVINQSLGISLTADNQDIYVERLVNQELGAIFGANFADSEIDEYIQLFIRTQNPIGDDFVVANTRYAIFQEGEDDKSYFAGEVTFDQAIVAPSDARAKDIDKVFEAGLEAIKQLSVYRYKWKEGYGNTEKEHIGVIAQEVEQAIPEAVTEGKHPKTGLEDFKSVTNDTLLFTAINAIKELSAKVEALEEEIAQLKSNG